MKKWLPILLVIFGAIALLGYVFWNDYRHNTFTSATHDVAFDYPLVLAASNLSNDDKETGFLIRLEETKGPEVLASLRFEEGLRAPANLLKKETLDLLLENLDRSYPQRFSEYKKQSEDKFERDGHVGAEIFFSYKGGTGETVKQRFMILVKDDDRAYYLSAQAKESEFNKLNSKYFERMFASLRFNDGND